LLPVFVGAYLPSPDTHLQHLEIGGLFPVVGVYLHTHYGAPLAFVRLACSRRWYDATKRSSVHPRTSYLYSDESTRALREIQNIPFG
jgi:hypothetical protein